MKTIQSSVACLCIAALLSVSVNGQQANTPPAPSTPAAGAGQQTGAGGSTPAGVPSPTVAAEEASRASVANQLNTQQTGLNRPELQPNRGYFGTITRPYSISSIDPVNLTNTNRLDQLMRAGRLYLSLQDAVALALENNLDIELARYGPQVASASLLRAQAGGLLRGVPTTVRTGPSSAISQAIGSGTGGFTTGGAGGGGSTVGGGTSDAGGTIITATGTEIPNLDPVVFAAYNWGHRTRPQANTVTTGTTAVVLDAHTINFGVQQGFVTGSTISLGYNSDAVRSNNFLSNLNPSTTGNLSLQFNQQLLRGFGLAVNSRNIKIAKNNERVSDLVFRQQVIATVASVVGLYWDLVTMNAEVKVKQQQLELNTKLYNDNKKQVEIGTLAPIEIVRAQAELARSEQELTTAETQVLQQETIIKNALSRTGVSNPALAEARIVPTDSVNISDVEPIAPVQDLVALALENRPEIAQTRLQIENTKIGLAGSRSQLLPSLELVGTVQNNGLAGALNSLPIPPELLQGEPAPPRNADPFFVGGAGSVFGQLFRRNFPDYAIGFQLSVPIRNRQAQADMITDQLSLRQQEIRQQQLLNEIRVGVANALIGIQQARARFQAAQKNRLLQEQALEAEQKKYALGAGTIFFVIQAQRDLAQAQATEVSALSAYTRAKTNLQVATGQILEVHDIQIEEARKGQVSRPPATIPVDQ